MARTSEAKPTASGDGGSVEVDAFLDALDHRHLPAIRAIRSVILGADASIGEGIKWKVPSFRTREYFATMHLRTKTGIGVILHFGARKRGDIPSRDAISDPAGLLQWLADDRAQVLFRDAAQVQERATSFAALLRNWIRYV